MSHSSAQATARRARMFTAVPERSQSATRGGACHHWPGRVLPGPPATARGWMTVQRANDGRRNRGRAQRKKIEAARGPKEKGTGTARGACLQGARAGAYIHCYERTDDTLSPHRWPHSVATGRRDLCGSVYAAQNPDQLRPASYGASLPAAILSLNCALRHAFLTQSRAPDHSWTI